MNSKDELPVNTEPAKGGKKRHRSKKRKRGTYRSAVNNDSSLNDSMLEEHETTAAEGDSSITEDINSSPEKQEAQRARNCGGRSCGLGGCHF